jgi:hypothetical protein
MGEMSVQGEETQEAPCNRHLNGEGWVICTDCGARLCSFDLPPGVYKDATRSCPTPSECKSK